MGYLLSYGEFSAVAKSTCLFSSYNAFNPYAKITDVLNFCREIGGVTTEILLLKGLLDSEAQALAEEYILCFPKDLMDVPVGLVRKLAREIDEAIFIHKTIPWFSLQFNNNGSLYPSLHTGLQNTLLARVIGFLDYWMKGFLNGGIYDEKFLDSWHQEWSKADNYEEGYLRSMLIDLKQYSKEHCPTLNYQSLRELWSRYQLGEFVGQEKTQFQQPFMTSFRIIAYLKEVKTAGNVVVFYPAFRMEYEIDLMPDYKPYLENYKKEQGCYPKEYEQIRSCYERYAEEVRENMPQLPVFRPFFQLLNLISSLCYFYATLEQMGKRVNFSPLKTEPSTLFPKALPPIPVRFFKTFAVDLNFEEVIKELINLKTGPVIDAICLDRFNQKRLCYLPKELVISLKQALANLIKSKLPSQVLTAEFGELREEELKKFTQQANQYFLQSLHQIRAIILYSLKNMPQRLVGPAFLEILALPLPTRLKRMEEAYLTKLNQLKARFEASPHLAKAEIFTEIPEAMTIELIEGQPLINLKGHIKQQFKEIEDKTNKELQELIQKITIEETADTQKQIADFKAQDAKELADFAAQKTVEKNTLISKTIAEVVQTHLNAQIEGTNNSIAQIQQHKNQQIASVPAHLRNLPANQAKISAFIASTDAEIAALNGMITQNQQKLSLLNKDLANLSTVLDSLLQEVQTFIDQYKQTITTELEGKTADLVKSVKEKVETATQKTIAEFKQKKDLSTQARINDLKEKAQQFIFGQIKDKAITVLTLIYENEIGRLNTFFKSSKPV